MDHSRRSVPALITVILVTAACGGRPAQHPQPQHLHDSDADTTPRPLRSAPRYAAGRGAYEVTSVTIVTHTVAGVPRTDTLTTRSIVHDDARWNARGLEVTGSVVSRILSASSGVDSMAPVVIDPVPFSAIVDTASSRVDFVSDSAAATVQSCPTPNTEALAAARDLLTAIPRSLAPSATWTDSLVSTACRGRFPVRSLAVRRFQVALERAPSNPEGVVIVVAHTTEARVAGAGRRDGEAVDLTGTRHAVARQQYDALTGQLLSGHVTSDLDLTVSAPDDMHHVHEHAETTVRPLAD